MRSSLTGSKRHHVWLFSFHPIVSLRRVGDKLTQKLEIMSRGESVGITLDTCTFFSPLCNEVGKAPRSNTVPLLIFFSPPDKTIYPQKMDAVICKWGVKWYAIFNEIPVGFACNRDFDNKLGMRLVSTFHYYFVYLETSISKYHWSLHTTFWNRN